MKKISRLSFLSLVMVLAFLFSISISYADVYDSIISKWDFTNTGNDTYGRINLTEEVNISYTPSPFGTAAHFNGTSYFFSDKIGIADKFANLRNLTMLSWIYRNTSTGGGRGLYSIGNKQNLGSATVEVVIDGSSDTFVVLQNSTQGIGYSSSQVALDTNSWMCHTTLWPLYVDADFEGVLNLINDSTEGSKLREVQYAIQNNLNFISTDITNNISIGAINRDVFENKFNGSIDYVAFFNSTLDNRSVLGFCGLPIVYAVSTDQAVYLDTEEIKGYCQGNPSFQSVNYSARWYKDGVLTRSINRSSTSRGLDLENVDTLSADFTGVGETWTFSCQTIFSDDTYFAQSLDQNTTFIISDFVVGACNTSLNHSILNITYRDEVSGDNISAAGSYDLLVSLGSSTAIVQDNRSTALEHAICTNLDPSEEVFNLSISGQFLFTKADYASRYFSVSPSVPIIATNANPYRLNISLIRLTNSTTVNYVWLTTSYQAINGIMEVYRCLGDGTKIIVESTPITDGKAIANIELLNIPYSYSLVTNGQRYENYDTFSACHLESQEEVIYYVDIDQVDITPQLGLLGTFCNATQSGSSIFRLQWGINPNSGATITGCAIVNRFGANGWVQTDQVCETDFDLSGTIPNTGYNYRVDTKLYQEGYSVSCESLEFVHAQSPGDIFGVFGLFSFALLFIGVSLLFVAQGEMMVFGGIIAILVGFIFGISSFSWGQISFIVIFLLMVLLIGRWVQR